jgi:hypothetical protein
MKKYKINIVLIIVFLLTGFAAYSVQSSKPESHNSSWIKTHGQSSKVNEEECLSCHTNRDYCIRCHQDTQPRNHTPAWVKRGHGLEARWNRDNCITCHKNDFCEECHTSSQPSYHTSYFKNGGHCYTQCHSPSLQETNCITCHKSYHGPQGPE